jgi:hypothetical protein
MATAIDKTEKGLSSAKHKELADKLSDAKIKACFEGKDDSLGRTRAAWSFVFCFAMGRSDYLVDETSKVNGITGITTAATDGKAYYWNVDFLSKLSKESTMIVYAHETMHIVLCHIDRAKINEKDPTIWNCAVDMAVNSYISDAYGKKDADALKPLLSDLGTTKILTVKDVVSMVKALPKNPKTTDDKCLYADPLALEKGAEWAYEEMIKHMPKQYMCGIGNPGDGEGGDGECDEGGNGSSEGKGSGKNGSGKGPVPDSLDQHKSASDSIEDAERIKRDIVSAATYAANQSKGAGCLPGALKDMLAEIEDPTLSVFDLIKTMVRTRAHNNGDKKNYSLYQKRPEYIYCRNASGVMAPRHKLFRPTKKSLICNWLCCFDTSGSMDMSDIVFGLKELKAMDTGLGILSKGWLIPMDSIVYWDNAVEVKNSRDIAKANVVGRGGTVFNEFFGEWDKHYPREDIDLIVCVTDGDFYEVPPNPGIDTVWLLTNGDKSVPFGRKFDLRQRIR